MRMTGHKHTTSAILAALVIFASFAIAGELLPKGWVGGNISDYDIGVDRKLVKEGKASAYIRSKTQTPKSFGTIVQTFSAKQYVGKRVRMSAFIKAKRIEGWTGLWMRVDGKGKENFSLSFDNMQTRPIKGTVDWKKYQIVLDVPDKSKSISFGIVLSGSGQAWLDAFTFEVVTEDIPVTGRTRHDLPEEPLSLGFEN
ncbi:hypothetical protein ACFLQU_05680 [Verrucomicrobiota bacterium]